MKIKKKIPPTTISRLIPNDRNERGTRLNALSLSAQ